MLLHLVELGRVDDGERVFLPVRDLGLERRVDLGEVERQVGDAPSALNIETPELLGGMRILKPFRSAGFVIGIAGS